MFELIQRYSNVVRYFFTCVKMIKKCTSIFAVSPTAILRQNEAIEAGDEPGILVHISGGNTLSAWGRPARAMQPALRPCLGEQKHTLTTISSIQCLETGGTKTHSPTLPQYNSINTTWPLTCWRAFVTQNSSRSHEGLLISYKQLNRAGARSC